MPRLRQTLVQLTIVAGLLGIWEAAVRGGLANPRMLPPPTQVAEYVVHLLSTPAFLSNLWVTTAQVGVAFIIVAPLGIGIGLLLGENEYLGRAFKPFFYFLAGVPKSVFLPIFILAFGIGFTQKVAFGIFQALFVLVISAIAAAGSVPPSLVRVARSYGATNMQLYAQIYLPSMLPIVIEGMRLGMIFNITGVVFAEMYVSRAGVGHMIATWGMSFQMPQLFAGVFIVAMLSIAVNETLRWYERRLGQWRVS